MGGNRVRKLRQKKGLTQRQMAEAVGTSQQQIQRIESGVQSCRLELAARICTALQQPMGTVFPAARTSLKNVVSKGLSLSQVSQHENIATSFEKAGIDVDPEVWTFKVWLRHHPSECFSISGIEQKRLRTVLQQGDYKDFVVFDSESERIALNQRHLLTWHFLWDPPFTLIPDEEPIEQLAVYLPDRTAPLKFYVDGDSAEFGPEENDGFATQLQGLFFTLETVGGEEGEVISFVDVDGEEVFLRTSEIALLRIPLWATEPKLAAAEDDDDTVGADGVEMSAAGNLTDKP